MMMCVPAAILNNRGLRLVSSLATQWNRL